ncbi:hypothetical protein HUJ04_000799 [Dendroctonus ponderosae]|nr:hypothetical protein HUJ04_000799 [Dendroctonus ponderosae]
MSSSSRFSRFFTSSRTSSEAKSGIIRVRNEGLFLMIPLKITQCCLGIIEMTKKTVIPELPFLKPD